MTEQQAIPRAARRTRQLRRRGIDMPGTIALLQQRDTRFGDDWLFVRERMSRCESPLEELFLVAWVWHFRDVTEITYCGESLPRYAGVRGKYYSTDLSQQAKVGRHRCDFLFTVASTINDKSKRVAVECDGHAFHERTKEQVSADRSRDRALLRGGIPTVRFTYHELTTNPDGCVRDELFAYLRSIGQELSGVQGFGRTPVSWDTILNQVPDLSAQKILIMSWWERKQITAGEAEELIHMRGLETA